MGKVARKKNGGTPNFFQNIQQTMSKNKIKLAGTEFEPRTFDTQSQHANLYTMEFNCQFKESYDYIPKDSQCANLLKSAYQNPQTFEQMHLYSTA